jgi:hypothetical protein
MYTASLRYHCMDLFDIKYTKEVQILLSPKKWLFHAKSTQATTWPQCNWIIFLCDCSRNPGKFSYQTFLWPLYFGMHASKFVWRILFISTCCLRKSVIISVLHETQSSFYVCFRANKMPCPITYNTNIFSTLAFLQEDSILYKLQYFSKIHIYVVELC